MGIRPNKSIGWGITVKGSELHEKALDQIINSQGLSYAGLFDFLEEHNLLEKHRKHFLTRKNFEKLDENNILFDYIEVISEDYDSEEDYDDQTWTIIFYPMVLSAIAGHDGADEYKDNSSPFTYAEIEKFFPESMEELKTFSYAIETPPFPSEYSVIHNVPEKTVDNFRLFEHNGIVQEIKRCLYAKPDDKFLEINVELAGFDSIEQLKETYSLAPAEEIFAFAQYSGLFKDSSIPFKLQPMVVYYWT